jgi:hypothetical protein
MSWLGCTVAGMRRSDFEVAAVAMAASSMTKLGASLFESSPIWKSIQSNTLAAVIGEPGLEELMKQTAKMASFSAPTQQLAALVANPVIEQTTSSFRRLSEELNRSVLADLKLPEFTHVNVEAVFKTGLLAQRLLAEQSALPKLMLAQPEDLLRQWGSLLGELPDLEYDVEEDEELAELAVSERTPLLTVEERILLLRAWWVFFVVAQLVTPEGRRLIDQYTVIWDLITAVVFSYHPE